MTEITDEMVELAANTHYLMGGAVVRWEDRSPGAQNLYRIKMRAALTAALSPAPQAQAASGPNCDCFGDTGLQASTYVASDGTERCDLCGKPTKPAAPQALAAEAESIVKPLVWVHCADGTVHDEGCRYEIERQSPDCGRPNFPWRVRRGVTGGGSYVGDADGPENAKAIAQADHDTRILSAIDLTGWLSPSHAREQAERIERLEAALTRIDEWARAYPEEAFPKPDLAICKTALESAGQSIDRLHASWARHILNGVGGITLAALADGGRDNG